MAEKQHRLWFLVALFLVGWIGGALFAGSAGPDPVTVFQPNGQSFEALIRGDERSGWLETLDGYTICKYPQTGYWEYAVGRDANGKLVSDGQRVGMNAAPIQAKNLRPKVRDLGEPWATNKRARWDPQSELGTRPVLIIMVSFSDRDFMTTPADWNQIIFGNQPDDKSVARFYRENSYAKAAIEPVQTQQQGIPNGIVSVKLTRTHPNYGAGDNFPSSLAHNDAETEWINQALSGINPFVDFASYDTNRNGRLSTQELNVYFILAGFDASVSSKQPNIWAHAWSAFRASGIRGDGLILENWALSGELHNSEMQNPFGVIAHEMGHSVFGLPDLYDTASSNPGVGYFSVMGVGSFGRLASETISGMTPGPMDPWCRYYLGWAEPRMLTNAQIAEFPAGLSQPDASVMLPIQGSEEFFLVENMYPSTIWHEGVRQPLELPFAEVLVANEVESSSALIFSPSGTVQATAIRCGLGKAGEFPSSVQGQIALIKRGEITFQQKVVNAKAEGALGVIVFNNQSGLNSGTLGAAGNYIPAVTMSDQAENLEGKEVTVMVDANTWSGGLLVLHVDPDNGSLINDSDQNTHQGVIVEEASTHMGSLRNNETIGHGTHLFSAENNPRFMSDSLPDSKTHGGLESGVGLSQISMEGPTMTARITRDARLAYVVPWVVNNQQWSSRVAFHNSGSMAESPLAIAVDRDGNSVVVELPPVPPTAVRAFDAAAIFPELSGYCLRIYASETVYPSFLTFNLDAPSGASPAQTTGMNTSQLDERLVFGYLPSSAGGVAALVLVAPEVSEQSTTSVNLSLYDGNGLVIANKNIMLQGGRPLATVVSELFEIQVEEGAVVATAESGVRLSGTTFSFNAQLEPAMALPFPNRANTSFALPWIVSNATWSSRIALFNETTTPAAVTLTATNRDGVSQTKSITVPGESLWRSESGDAFTNLSGYSLLIDSDQPLFPSFLAFNLESASQRSPAQTTGTPLSQLNNELVFPYVPSTAGGISALVLMAPGAQDQDENSITLALHDDSGAVLETKVVELRGVQPLASVISHLFSTPPKATMSVTAQAAEGIALAGTTFVFNGSNEPSMSQAFSPRQ